MRLATGSVILSTALGGVTTVLVAWAIHLTGSPAGRSCEVLGRARRPELNEGVGFVDVERIRGFGKTWLELLAAGPPAHIGERAEPAVPDTLTSALPAWERRLCTPWEPGAWPAHDRAYVTAVGWPCRALWHEYRYNPQKDQPPTFLMFNLHPPAHTYDTPGAIRLGWFTTEFGGAAFKVPGSLPYRPLAGGFVINTMLYAVLWAAVLEVPGRVRRWRRMKRGLCPACAYDLRSTLAGAPCPECGWRAASS